VNVTRRSHSFLSVRFVSLTFTPKVLKCASKNSKKTKNLVAVLGELGCKVPSQWCYSVSEWCHSGVTVLSECCQSGVTVVLQCCQSGVTVLLQWCHLVVTVVLPGCGSRRAWMQSAVTSVLQCVRVVSQWCYNGVTVVSPCCYSGVTVLLQWCYLAAVVGELRCKGGLIGRGGDALLRHENVTEILLPCITVVSHSCHITFLMVLVMCYSGITVLLQFCHRGVRVVLWGCPLAA
jgi:hypothetical protein